MLEQLRPPCARPRLRLVFASLFSVTRFCLLVEDIQLRMCILASMMLDAMRRLWRRGQSSPVESPQRDPALVKGPTPAANIELSHDESLALQRVESGSARIADESKRADSFASGSECTGTPSGIGESFAFSHGRRVAKSADVDLSGSQPSSHKRSAIRALFFDSSAHQVKAQRSFSKRVARDPTPRLLETRRGETYLRRYALADETQIAFRIGYEGAVECAASNLAARLGSDMVPPTVAAFIEGEQGFAQQWIPASSGLDVGEPIRTLAWTSSRVAPREASEAAVVLLLAGVRDLHSGNWLIRDDDRRLAIIDFAGGFLRFKWDESSEESTLQAITQVRFSIFEELRTLKDSDVRAIVQPLCTVPWFDVDESVAGVLARRDRIVSHIEQLIAERGVGAVLL